MNSTRLYTAVLTPGRPNTVTQDFMSMHFLEFNRDICIISIRFFIDEIMGMDLRKDRFLSLSFLIL